MKKILFPLLLLLLFRLPAALSEEASRSAEVLTPSAGAAQSAAAALTSSAGAEEAPRSAAEALMPLSYGAEGEETQRTAEKAALSEGNLRDNMALYADQDEPSVITMYLTVTKGNSADGTDHTWTEINTYSVYDYEKMGVDRYMAEGILQIDETGEGVTADSFGFGAAEPNVSVKIRGQSSTARPQKNFKIRIKKGKGSFREQRTLNLNKHTMIPFRFTNKLCYRWVQRIPQLIGGRTQFVRLFVKDLTEGGSGEYRDYGLYTMVEQVNRTFLKNHLLDENGELYKITFFEWYKYEAVMMAEDDPEFDRAAFESYLEIKGNGDHRKLRTVLEDINNYLKPIQVTVEEHFNAENLCWWMAFNILVSNYDSSARNWFLYSPLNSEKFYVIPWDLDASLRRTYLHTTDHVDGESWERGLQLFLGLRLVNRMMKEQEYRDMLTAAVEDIYRNILTPETVLSDAGKLRDAVKPYLFDPLGPDYHYLQVKDEADFDALVEAIPAEIADNYAYYYESLEKPWPFFVDLPVRDEKTGQYILSWGISYDPKGEPVTYDWVLARDLEFRDVVARRENLSAPTDAVASLDPGTYYLKVVSRDASGDTMDCFDYFATPVKGKVYGCYAFNVLEDGSTAAWGEGE